MTKRLFVLDTSVFVNPASARAFGESPTEALRAFLQLSQAAPDIELYMPPSIYAELMHFAQEKKIPEPLRNRIQQKAPRKHELRVPGIFIYELVESMRDRVDRGLRQAERHVREALSASAAPVAGSVESKRRADAEAISGLRESFRRIMREGMLDSRADVDLLLLAYEIDATLVSADLGVLAWAENLGLRTLPHDRLKSAMTDQ